MGASEDHVLNESFEGKLHLMFDTIASRMIISKGDFLIREGETERNLYLVESGALRVFYLSEFEEMTIRFGYRGSIITSLSSFIKGTPSEFYIDAIRRTTWRPPSVCWWGCSSRSCWSSWGRWCW